MVHVGALSADAESLQALWDGPGRRRMEVELPEVEREIVNDLCARLKALQWWRCPT